ncbi:MAG TPA: AMP-binding protein, partial [Verrucomicrobiae bacterium]|nr:AMP-binding protein [Verrucomicrobiae bacterium]
MIAGDILGERARLTPDKIALVLAASGHRFTYAQINQGSIRCAASWHSRGIQKGERVGILAHNRLELIEA